MLFQTVYGPLGLPYTEAIYPPIITSDNSSMNAINDYVIRIKKDDMPPAMAFWSISVYDTASGFFIPNDRKKYSVGENTGYKLNSDGGIDIYISEKLPNHAFAENWLPIIRKHAEIDVVMRIYVPELEKMKT